MTRLLIMIAFIGLSAHAMDPAYQKALDEAVKQCPPGDYNSPVLRRFTPDPLSVQSFRKSNSEGAIEKELLQPVEMPDKEIKTLFSEAAMYFTKGRYNLATKRYKQALLLDPENINAKAYLYDITVIRSMHLNGSDQSLLNKEYNALKERISKDFSASAPTMDSLLTIWRKGDKSEAVSRFVETNWSTRPLFAPGSTLSLSEEQFHSLTDDDRQSRVKELEGAGDIHHMAMAVQQAGLDAAKQNDPTQARKCFISLQECGRVLKASNNLRLLQVIGGAMENIGDTRLAEIKK